MKKSDTERIKKIVSTWDALKRQIDEHSITKEQLLDDEFSQWAVTTPLYNIGEQVYKISDETKKQNPQIISLIKEYRKETDSNKLISIKQILYQDEDYQQYIKSYNELSLIILRINKQDQKYTNTAEHNCH